MKKNSKKELFTIIFYIFIFSFLMHFLWESIHSLAYTPGSAPHNTFLLILLIATFYDAAFMIIVYLILALINNNFKWIYNPKAKDYIFILFFGFAVAAFVEYINVYALNNWSYNNYMPIIPWLNVGLLPILQLMILPIIIYKLTVLVLR